MSLADLVSLSILGVREPSRPPAPMRPITFDPAPLCDAEVDFLHLCIRCVQLQHAVFSSAVFMQRIVAPHRRIEVRVKMIVPDRNAPPAMRGSDWGDDYIEVRRGEDAERAQQRYRAETLAQMQGTVPKVSVFSQHELYVGGDWEFGAPEKFVERYARFVRDALCQAVCHEVDEMMLVSGERVFDQHVDRSAVRGQEISGKLAR